MATRLRETLLVDASALARRELVDAQRLTEFKGATGYRQVAFELLGLATVLRERWADIASKTAIQAEELDQAEKLAERILHAVGMKEQTPSVTEAAKRRATAFYLFVRLDQVRRAVTFLRWNEGDVDRIAPSVYAGRTSGRRKEETKSQSTPAPSPAAPAPAGTSPAAPAPAGASRSRSRRGGWATPHRDSLAATPSWAQRPLLAATRTTMTRTPSLSLGMARPLDGSALHRAVVPAHHLVTHGVIVGMSTGSGRGGPGHRPGRGGPARPGPHPHH